MLIQMYLWAGASFGSCLHWSPVAGRHCRSSTCLNLFPRFASYHTCGRELAPATQCINGTLTGSVCRSQAWPNEAFSMATEDLEAGYDPGSCLVSDKKRCLQLCCSLQTTWRRMQSQQAVLSCRHAPSVSSNIVASDITVHVRLHSEHNQKCGRAA